VRTITSSTPGRSLLLIILFIRTTTWPFRLLSPSLSLSLPSPFGEKTRVGRKALGKSSARILPLAQRARGRHEDEVTRTNIYSSANSAGTNPEQRSSGGKTGRARYRSRTAGEITFIPRPRRPNRRSREDPGRRMNRPGNADGFHLIPWIRV